MWERIITWPRADLPTWKKMIGFLCARAAAATRRSLRGFLRSSTIAAMTFTSGSATKYST